MDGYIIPGRRGVPIPGRRGGRVEVPTYKIAIFYQKLHEIKNLLLCMGGTVHGICHRGMIFPLKQIE